ncbi:MAG: response regulator, partial [Planctomycetota bacterium]
MEQDFTSEFTKGFAESFSEAAAAASQAMRILVADSNATIRKLLRMGLSNEDYEIIEATSGPDAYEIATATPEPHAILLDAGLAGKIDGLEVCRRLKAD